MTDVPPRPESVGDAPPARRGVLYPEHYLWYVLVSALDLIVTHTVLSYLGFEEANTIADRVIDAAGFGGLIAFKFATVLFVVLICEIVGARRPRVGRLLATAAIAISVVPIAIALLQLVLF
ncbi:MAG: DUF5658 family protein [Phycisphaerales bacterium]